MTETRAMQILRDNGVWDSVVSSRPSLTANLVNALMQAVAEERDACTTDSALMEITRSLLTAIEKAEEVGCIDHLDCWDSAAVDWYAPIDRARNAVSA